MDHLQKTKKQPKILKKQEIHDIFIKNGMTYGDFKDLTRRTATDKMLHDKAFNIAKNSKDDGYQKGLASIAYKLFDRKASGGAI